MAQRAERVLFVHAHPDDESIWTGATIATLVQSGASVTLLTCTLGELGGVTPPELKHLEGTAELAARRSAELDAAAAALGVTDHRILGTPSARWAGREPRVYRDSGMRDGPKGPLPVESPDPASLIAADLGDVAADIAAVMLELEPDLVVSYAADGGYGHPDHVRAHEAARTAAEVLRMPFYVVDSTGTKRGPVVVDPTPVLERKRAALLAHRTQITVDGDTFSLSVADRTPIDAPESFTRLRPPGTGFADHSIPSRISSCVLAAGLGAFAGVTLTVAHQASVQFAGLTVPWGIIAALVITAALLAGLRLVFETRIVALCAAIGLFAASAVLALQSTGGSVLVPANAAGYTWTFAPVVIALAVLAWPRFTRAAGGNIGVPSAKGPDLP